MDDFISQQNYVYINGTDLIIENFTSYLWDK